MPITLDLLLNQEWMERFDPQYLRRGQAYAAEGMARIEAVEDALITASCRGSAGKRYKQRIVIGPPADHWRITGQCTCPVAYNCKHVVAALLELQRLQQLGQVPLAAPPVRPAPAAKLPERWREDVVPQVNLLLNSHSRPVYDGRSKRMVERAQHRAALYFDYDGLQVSGKRSDSVSRKTRSEIQHIRRDSAQEQLWRTQLEQWGFKVATRKSEALDESLGELYELKDDSSWLSFVQKGIPALHEQHWQIRMLPGFAFNLQPVDQWYGRIDEDPEHTWFDLELGILVDGQPVSLLPILLSAIRWAPSLFDATSLARRRDDELLLVPLDNLADGRQPQRKVALSFGRIRPLLAVLGELYFDDLPANSPTLRLQPADALRLSSLAEQPLEWQGGDRLRQLARQARHLQQQPPAAPAALHATLRTYQLEGLAWMQSLRTLGVHGILADDMGLGKTLQTLAHILLEKQQGRLDRPALVIMPTSLIPNWQDEAARFAPDLRVLALHGSRRRQAFARIAEHDLVLTSYALLSRDAPLLAEQDWHLLILDEAQYIKNARSKAATAATTLRARHRLCLTGTPLENHLGELWAQFHFLMPGWLGDAKQFTRQYRTPIEKHGSQPRQAALASRIKPFMLRRTKEAVVKELPAKTEIIKWVELNPEQRDLYETLRLAMDDKVRAEIHRKGLARSQIVILEALLKLRQVCCDPRLLQDSLQHGPGSKLLMLLDMLDSLLAEGRRILLFSQFTSMLALIEDALRERRIAYSLLTGQTRDRRQPVEDFQSGQTQVFLISLKAGGTGLNLTAADTVIHYDPWWNPAAENQATDRAYRIGQDKPVFVYKLIGKGTVEEKIQQLQGSKQALADDLLNAGSQGNWSLEQADLERLFAPLEA